MRLQLAVQRAKERPAAAVEMLPGILAVEDDRDDAPLPRRFAPRSGGPPRPGGSTKSAGRRRRRPSRSTTNPMRSDSEWSRNTQATSAPPALHAVRRVEALRLIDDPRRRRGPKSDAKRVRQNLLVRRHPRESRPSPPAAPWRPTPSPRTATGRRARRRTAVRDTRPRVPAARWRPRDAGTAASASATRMRAQVDVGVAQERQNRVVERRRRDLDLARARCRRGIPESRDSAARARRSQQPLLVVLGEVPVLWRRAPESAHRRQVDRIEPGQLLPDLQVAEVVDRKPARPPVARRPARGALPAARAARGTAGRRRSSAAAARGRSCRG